jgi:hypothetical protein
VSVVRHANPWFIPDVLERTWIRSNWSLGYYGILEALSSKGVGGCIHRS